jgi:hypothetical protein
MMGEVQHGPIRPRRAVCWLEAIWLGAFLVPSQRRDTLLDLTGRAACLLPL